MLQKQFETVSLNMALSTSESGLCKLVDRIQILSLTTNAMNL